MNKNISMFENSYKNRYESYGEEERPVDFGSLRSTLEEFLHSDSAKDLWDNQVEAAQSVIDALASKKHKALIKKPTGAGKTRLFVELARVFQMQTLILVPKSLLLSQIQECFLSLGIEKNEVCSFSESKKSVTGFVESALKERGKYIILTYQGLNSLKNRAPVYYKELLKKTQLIISDEGHRSLGSNTLNSVFPQGVDHERNKLFFTFTATPNLLLKGVENTLHVESIYSTSFENLFEKEILVPPREVSIGKAIFSPKEKESTDMFGNPLKEVHLHASDSFIMENGKSVFEATADAYLEEKNKAQGYLPGVAFCNTIVEAEKYAHYLQSRGVRALRCTTDVHELQDSHTVEEINLLFQEKQLDIVTTVSKVGEGWDLPLLRTAVWLAPTKSSARYIQGSGRVLRSFAGTKEHPGKDSSNTCIIEPRWIILRKHLFPRENSLHDRTPKEGVSNDQREGELLFESKHFYEWLFANDEISSDFLVENCIKNGLVHPNSVAERTMQFIDYFKSTYSYTDWPNVFDTQTVIRKKLPCGAFDYAEFGYYLGMKENPTRNRVAHLEVGKKIWDSEEEQQFFDDLINKHIDKENRFKKYVSDCEKEEQRLVEKYDTKEKIIEEIRKKMKPSSLLQSYLLGMDKVFGMYSDKILQVLTEVREPGNYLIMPSIEKVFTLVWDETWNSEENHADLIHFFYTCGDDTRENASRFYSYFEHVLKEYSALDWANMASAQKIDLDERLFSLLVEEKNTLFQKLRKHHATEYEIQYFDEMFQRKVGYTKLLRIITQNKYSYHDHGDHLDFGKKLFGGGFLKVLKEKYPTQALIDNIRKDNSFDELVGLSYTQRGTYMFGDVSLTFAHFLTGGWGDPVLSNKAYANFLLKVFPEKGENDQGKNKYFWLIDTYFPDTKFR